MHCFSLSIPTVYSVTKNEKKYYERLVEVNIRALHIFPYHLADVITKGLRVTPFNYYTGTSQAAVACQCWNAGTPVC